MIEPIWVRDDVVLAIHQRQLAEHGGGTGIRDAGLLDSALNKPKNQFHYNDPKPSIAAMAASYAYAIACNHPFVDGNKRTAYIVCQLFLSLNGYVLTAPPADKYQIFINLASGKLSDTKLSAWISENIASK